MYQELQTLQAVMRVKKIFFGTLQSTVLPTIGAEQHFYIFLALDFTKGPGTCRRARRGSRVFEAMLFEYDD